MPDPKRPQRIDERIGDSRGAPIAPASPQPFTPSGLCVHRVVLVDNSRAGKSSAAVPIVATDLLRGGPVAVGRRLTAHHSRALSDRQHDVVIAGTATEIPLEIFADIALGRVGVVLDQV